ncbi:MAG: valine--tRNA ligase [Bdellovibrionota bacterium]
MLEQSYTPENFEEKIYTAAEEKGMFRAEGRSKPGQKSFLITMPPPNVTGALHIGHALFVSIQDTYTRWKRMLGYNTLWLPGTDHAGIATQVMVEKQVAAEGTSRQQLGREAFLKRVWEWKKEFGGTITDQIRVLGSSTDWSRELFTLDTKSSNAVKASFTKLYHDGLIYRGERIVNWSSGLQTAISDLEVELKPVQGAFYYVKYMLADGSGALTVATTRPETIFADVAVAVNPDDERFAEFRGKEVIVPLSGRRIPVIEDSYVDKEFGTGALKITPGHDANDWAIGHRHQLKTLTTINKDGKLNELAGEFAGMVAAHSRKKVAEKLKELGLLVKEEKHNYELGYCQRTGVVVEPLVSMQWFMKMKPMAEMALKAASGEDPALRFYPDFWKKTWFQWLNNIQDWGISRQLWWGHQIPAWHCEKCAQITVPKNEKDLEPKVCVHCGSALIHQDPDVLDTWYSSALWPISTLGWPEKTQDLETFYPQLRFDELRQGREAKALMETGSDILFFWVARMVMMCTYFMDGRLPFEDVFLHAMVFDEKGQKMSKTKGNVVDPLDVTAKSGSDTLRLTLLALSGQGRNVNLDLKRLDGYKAFLNKLWNASKFSLMQLSEQDVSSYKNPMERLAELDFVDRWLLSELNETVKRVNEELTHYRPDAAFNAMYQFIWYEFCDWYLELVKVKKGSLDTLCYTLETLLKLLHPMAPMVTERIYSELPWAQAGQLMVQKFPVAHTGAIARDSDLAEIRALKAVVDGTRNFRTENKIPPRTPVNAFLNTDQKPLWEKLSRFVVSLAKLGDVSVNAAAPGGASGKVATNEFTLTIPLEGLVDTSAEKSRLQNEIKRVRTDVEFSLKRLENPAFVERAKPELVEKERATLTANKEKLAVLEEALKRLG